MINFRKPTNALRTLETLRAALPIHKSNPASRPNQKEEIRNFGSNLGNLRMFAYTPPSVAGRSALVVVLHGCGQTAAGYDHGAGWSTLADRYGFSLLMPEQQRSNNPNGCFNWFQPEDTQRGRGEAASIHQMVETMVQERGIDRGRVFITGLSAGGAMTSAMLACYPDVFAAGAIIAGLPYGAASNVQQAFESMFQCPQRSARDWGELVHGAALQHEGSWPRVSVWHGSADKTVIPSNAGEIIKQWTAVHELSIDAFSESTVDGYPRQAWLNEAGEEIIESYSITNMAHGTPLATGDSNSECGAAGPFLLEVGISSSFHIAKFFGLTETVAQPSVQTENVAPSPTRLPVIPDSVQPRMFRRDEPKATRAASGRSPRVDVAAMIKTALEAAGLMRRD